MKNLQFESRTIVVRSSFLTGKNRNCCGKKEQIFSLKIRTNEKKTGEELKDVIAQSRDIYRKRVSFHPFTVKSILLLADLR